MKALMYPPQNRCLMNFVNFVNQKKKNHPFYFLNYADSSHLIHVSPVHTMYDYSVIFLPFCTFFPLDLHIYQPTLVLCNFSLKIINT